MRPFEDINPEQVNYVLPDEKIAAFPSENRDQSNLLIRDKDGVLKKDVFRNIGTYLPEKSLLFFNNSRVIPARLVFSNLHGSRIEIFCLKPIKPSDYAQSLQATSKCSWECLVGNLKRFKDPSLQWFISTPGGDLTLNAAKLSQTGNLVIIEFSWDDPRFTFSELLTMIGRTPLPPYIKRDPVPNDKERYQTIYSRFDGSVAAPTAGLHFTSGVFENLAKKNIACHEITLHVGAGTFQPIKSDRVVDHTMHSEYIKVTTELLKILSSLPARVAGVGTTTVRTLESMYWLGVKISRSPDISPIDLHLDQWEPYDLPKDLTLKSSFEAFETWMKKQGISELMASTSLMIVPGYSFKVVDTLITNFHQPRSTLLLLIAAFIGESWKETYDYALKEGFRFLSYGDSSLLFNQPVG